MAKSIRSKQRRKMRAIKRVRNDVRDLERLKRITSKMTRDNIQELTNSDTTVTVRPKYKSKFTEVLQGPSTTAAEQTTPELNESGGADANPTAETEPMNVDSLAPKYNKRTMKDEQGQYPPWMNQARIRKQKKQLKLVKKGKAKKKMPAW